MNTIGDVISQLDNCIEISKNSKFLSCIHQAVNIIVTECLDVTNPINHLRDTLIGKTGLVVHLKKVSQWVEKLIIVRATFDVPELLKPDIDVLKELLNSKDDSISEALQSDPTNVFTCLVSLLKINPSDQFESLLGIKESSTRQYEDQIERCKAIAIMVDYYAKFAQNDASGQSSIFPIGEATDALQCEAGLTSTEAEKMLKEGLSKRIHWVRGLIDQKSVMHALKEWEAIKLFAEMCQHNNQQIDFFALSHSEHFKRLDNEKTKAMILFRIQMLREKHHQG